MEAYNNLIQIRDTLMNAVKVLQDVSDQTYHIESHIKRVLGSIHDLENGKPVVNLERGESNIIPFPVCTAITPVPIKDKKVEGGISNRPFLYEVPRKHPFLVPILAKLGNPLPVSIPDFRDLLQRDGLILLSWDKRITETKELFTAYWVTSTGVCRYFASVPLPEKDFANAQPDHKSYAAEDGIEFYGQPRPYYIVHVVPELMMTNRGKVDKRPVIIKKLKELGVETDFEHKYLLTKEKKKFPNRWAEHRKHGKTGA